MFNRAFFLKKRRAVRRSRRNRHTRYRKPKFANRRRPKGWLAPSLLSRVLHLVTWVKRLARWCPVGAISQELVRFDTALLQDPAIAGQEYQRGTLFEAEIKEYLTLKWQHRCAYCAATNTRLELDHVHPRSKGGSNRVSNLVIACRTCNKSKADQAIETFLADRPDVLAHIQAQQKMPLADAAAVNSTRWRLYEALQAFGLPVEVGTGGRTRWNRYRLDLPKKHWIDAAMVGASTPEAVRLAHVIPWLIEATGRQARRMCNIDEYGFPRGRAKGPGRIQGFTTGDLVRAVVTKGKKRGTYIGRVAIKSDGYFKITGQPFGMVEGVHVRYCTPIHRKDGYSYAKGMPASSPSLKRGATAGETR
jgi:5-methylcytosine-specific restriction endonuclease McrA